MASTTNTKHTCADCAFFSPEHLMCKRANVPARPKTYACPRFMTREAWAKECEEKRQELLRKEEERLNFILTAMMISATSTQMFLEYFDAQFKDRAAESDWRFKRAQAAKDIIKAADRIRTLYQHNFMEDQNRVMTAHGTQPYDVQAYENHEAGVREPRGRRTRTTRQAYENHEADGRYWSLCLCHQLDSCWQDPEAEADVIRQYEARPHLGIFHPKDFRHFTTKR